MTTNFQRTAAWLHACGKTREPQNLSVQIGCHIEEFVEFLDQLELDAIGLDRERLAIAGELLDQVAFSLKKNGSTASIPAANRERALDALCDMEVTGNGVAYLAGFDKNGADLEVLGANDAKLVDGRPVLLEGGKIGKPPGWRPANLGPFV